MRAERWGWLLRTMRGGTDYNERTRRRHSFLFFWADADDHFNDNDYETGNNFKYTKPEVSQYESPCWGWPASFADTDNNRFYLFSARYRTSGAYAEYYDQNAYIVTSFLLPTICTVGETVILYPEDIVDQFTTEFDVFVTQGGTLYDGKIYYTYGFGGLEYPNAIRVFDLAEKKIVAKIDLSDSIFSNEEIESCGVYEGALLCNTNSGKIYQLDYIESLWKEEPGHRDSITQNAVYVEKGFKQHRIIKFGGQNGLLGLSIKRK